MPERIPQSVSKLCVFRAFLASDGKTLATGKTIAITISKNGGAFGNPNVGALNATEISSGFYKFTLDTTDTGTQGPLAWRGAEATINDAADIYTVADPHNAGFDALPSTACTTNASVVTSGTGTDQISLTSGRVDTGKISGTTQTARDIGASVLLSVGTGAGQVNLSSGKVPATLASTDVTGNVPSDLQTVKTQSVTCAAGITVNQSVGTTQPLNFTGTGATAQLNATDGLVYFTAASATATTVVGPGSLSAQDNFYRGGRLCPRAGTGNGQPGRLITAYNGTSKTFTVAPAWTTTPDNTTAFTVDDICGADVQSWALDAAGIAVDANHLPKVDTEDIKGTASAATAGYMGPDWSHVNAPTTTVVLSGTTIGVCTTNTDMRGTDNAALAATALSTAQWTNARAAKLDDLDQAISTILTTAMTESYAADGVAPTLAQAIFLTMQSITEFAISGTTKTIKKLDGSTTAATETLDSATAPTSITRTT